DSQASFPVLFATRIELRDAIIARTDSKGGKIMFIDSHVQSFQSNVTFPTPIGSITDLRGWAAVDLMIRGQAFPFVNTHLDSDVHAVQVAQAKELIQKAGDTSLPLVFTGDFNANASDPSNPSHQIYQLLIDAGFADAWKEAHPSAPGFTCCQDPDLRHPSELSQRIDLVM